MRSLLFLIFISFIIVSCGVKGAPLPPETIDVSTAPVPAKSR